MPQEQLANSNNLGVEHFRILVIGNANAGKTTILKKVCHAEGRKPVYLNIDSELEPSASRGKHNIEHQFQYPSAHGFIFHDSRGFEAGGADELKKVKDFIENRAKSEQLKDQLHVIWYCLPTSNDRGLTEAEMSLFQSGTGNVPVIAIFTKMDALDNEARNQLMWDGLPPAKIKEEVPIRAEAIFKKNYLQRMEEVKHRPHHVVQLRDMHKEGADCEELIVKTSRALNRDTLRLFCLSILRSDAESRIKHVINQIIIPQAQAAFESCAFSKEQSKSLFCKVMYCFPHMLPSFNKLILKMNDNAIDATTESVNLDHFHDDLRRDLDFLDLRLDDLRRRLDLHLDLLLLDDDRHHCDDDNDINHLNDCFEVIFLHLPLEISSGSPWCKVVWLGIVTMIIIHYCLFATQSVADFPEAVNFYMTVSTGTIVDDVKKACQGSASVMEDSDKLFNILMKNVLACKLVID